jgi:signal transduction histidine kinase
MIGPDSVGGVRVGPRAAQPGTPARGLPADVTPPPAPAPTQSRFRPRFTLRLRLTLLFAALLAVIAVTLLGTAAVVLDRTLRSVPQFPPGQKLVLRDESGGQITLQSDQFAELVRHQARSELLRAGGVAFAVVVLVGLGAGYMLAGQALQPVSRVTATARRLSTETLDSRIALQGPNDELKELADTFDDMLARLDAAFDSQRRFVANASHELRTPLAVIRTEVDVTLGDPDATVEELRTMGEVVREASVRADRLVDALLVLARSEAQARVGLELRERVDLAGLVEAAVAATASEAQARSISVRVESAPAPTEGDPQLLERLVGNLVENAVRHNIEGGWVQVRTDHLGADAAADPAGPLAGRAIARLVVASSGAEISAAAVEELFEPFRRGGTARTASTGAGLGLSIVRAVTAAHGGEVTAQPQPKGGLLVVVRLPDHQR